MSWIAFDVETTGTQPLYGLQPHRVRQGSAHITSMAVATGPTFEQSKGVIDPTKEQLRKFLLMCSEKKHIIVGWNVAFDAAWLIAQGLRDEVYACRWLDGMLAYKHFENAPRGINLRPDSYGLKQAVERFRPERAGYDDGIDFDDMSPGAVAARLRYNRWDAFLTYDITHWLFSQLSQRQRTALSLDCQCIPMVAETYVDGITASKAKAEELSTDLLGEYKTAAVLLAMEGNDVTEEQLSSPKQLSKLLYEDWQLPILKHTAKGASSTDRDTLTQLAFFDERAAKVNTYREAKNNRTKFAEGMVNSLDYNEDGRTYPSATIFSTYTGRMTYSSKVGKGVAQRPLGVALHQWKRDPKFRNLITAPDGYTMMELDWASQEFRWMGVLSGDETMLSLCHEGEDAHTFMGSRVAGTDYREELRLLAAEADGAYQRRHLGKVANLSLQYRTGAGSLQRVARTNYGVDIKLSEAKSIHATYRTTYTRVPDYWQNQISHGKASGFVETQGGRRVRVGYNAEWGIGLDPAKDEWMRGSTCINAPIQGSGADQKYLGLAVAKNILNDYDGRFYFELHDGLFFIAPTAKAEGLCVKLLDVLSHLPYRQAWGKTYPIEFPVDAMIGRSWGDMRELNVT